MIRVEQKTVTAINLSITPSNSNVVIVQDSLNNDMPGSLVVEPEALPNLIAALSMIHNARILRPTQGYGYEETNETARERHGTRHEAEHGQRTAGRRRHRTP